MTQEEKAKAYDKAIEVMRKCETDKYGCVIGIKPSDLFREFQESEDEKTRKEITEFFKNYSEHGTWKAISDVTRWIAFLEKLSEQKPADKYKPMSLDEAIKHCKEKSCGNNACSLEHKQLEKWLTELKKLKEQKSAEWSEIDKANLEDSIYFVKEFRRSNLCNNESRLQNSITCIEWLASLKDRVLPQPMQEWSEEDEKRVESLHGWLDTLVNYIHHDVTVSLDLRRERMQQVEQLKTWLKPIKDRYNWKPSDVQMRILSIYADQNNTHGSVLTSLYNDLKKLREE